MHVVSFSERVTVAGVELEPGVGYVMNNTGAGSLLTDRRLVKCRDGMLRPLYRLVKVTPLGEMKLVPTADYNGCTLWMFRAGGYGDMLMLTPTIREINRRWPEGDVCVVTLPEYADVFTGLPCRVRTGFLPALELGVGHAAIFYEGVIEDNPAARHRHGVLLFADHAGIDFPMMFKDRPEDTLSAQTEQMRPSYFLTPGQREWAAKLFPRTGRRRVGIQATPSAAARTYPPALLVQVINELVARDIEVFVFGKPGQVECEIAGVTNLTSNDLVVTFRESAAVLTTCDVLLCPDSAFLHLAAALDVPTVALFGSFDAKLRVTPGARVTVLQGKADCAPCHWHESGGRQFPPDGPCQVAGCCSVLASIMPARVVAAVETMLQETAVAEVPTDVFYSGATGELVARAYRRAPVAVVYDFLGHKIGDTIAALYLLNIFCRQNPFLDLHLINRGALPIDAAGLLFHCTTHADMPRAFKGPRRLNFEFGNLWIAAPSAWKDGFTDRFTSVDSTEPKFDVGIHCLTDATYNVKRNHDAAQFFNLHRELRLRGLDTYCVLPPSAHRTLLDVVEHMRKCRAWIGGDTGFSHLFAALFPDRPLIAIYPDDSGDRAEFERERQRMRAWWRPDNGTMSSPWCSDPLTPNLHKFVMQDHQFDFRAVVNRVLEVVNPIEI